MSGITIAIDGYSACGKSTLARQLASYFGYLFIDSGAMYRAVTFYAIQKKLILEGNIEENKLISHLANIHLKFEEKDGCAHIFLNGQDVEDEIRQGEVPNFVSKVAAIREVREKLVEEQRKMALYGGIVMDGRDIGTVVFPNAELKLFVTASKEVRVERRWKELQKKGVSMSKIEIQKNLESRDLIDTTRIESPLRKAKDAILLDNSTFTKEEQLNWVIKLVEQVLTSKNLS